jgi:hypothetical protein
MNGTQLATLATPGYTSAVRLYIDCLSVLHDTIEQIRIFGWERMPPRFLGAALRGMIAERTRARLRADDRWAWIGENIDINFATAENLTIAAERFPPVREPISWSAELIMKDSILAAFANEILKQYMIVRFVRAGQRPSSEEPE